MQVRNKTRSGRVTRLLALFKGSLQVNKYCFDLQKLFPSPGCGGRWLWVLGWSAFSQDAGRELQPWVVLTSKQVSWETYSVNTPSSCSQEGAAVCAWCLLSWAWLVQEQLCPLHEVVREMGSLSGRGTGQSLFLGMLNRQALISRLVGSKGS